MGNWWKIARIELLLALKDREAVIWSLLAPVGMAWFMGVAFDGGTPGPTQVRLESADNPPYVETIVRGLLEKKEFRVVSEGESPLIVLPDSMVHKFVAGQGVVAQIVADNIGRRAQAASVELRKIIYALSFRVKESWLTHPPDDAEIAALVETSGPIYVESRTLGTAPKIATGVEHTLPAMLVMFLLFQLMTFFMVTWVDDLKTGKIKRITMSPTSMRELFVSQLASRLLWATLQVAVIGGVGSLLLGVRLEVPWGFVGVLLLAYMVTAISLGLFMGSMFKTVEKANAVGVITSLVLAALGGCWWPLEVVPDAMKSVAMILPTGIMMDAFGDFVAAGKNAPFPTANFAALMATSTVLMPLAIHRMRRQITS